MTTAGNGDRRPRLRLALITVLGVASAAAAMSGGSLTTGQTSQIGGVISSESPAEPRADTLPPERNARCASYAQTALDDYSVMQRFPQCLVPNDPRWQANVEAHYEWCMANMRSHGDWIDGEARARHEHLVNCGVRKSY